MPKKTINLYRRIIIFLALLFVGLLTVTAIAIGTNNGFSNQSPANGTTINTDTPNISVHLNTSGGTYDINQVSMSIDSGSLFKPSISGIDPDYDISFTPTQPLYEGTHNVNITIPNINDPNTPFITNWSFNVAVPPVVNKIAPTYTVTTSTPVISAYATDSSGLAKAEIKIDNISLLPQAAKIDFSLGHISYTPATPLIDGQHTVFLTVYDTKGNTTATSWNFNVDTNIGGNYAHMPVINDATCWTCHPTLVVVNDGTASNNIVLGGKHFFNQVCQNCHTNKTAASKKFLQCTYCHYDNYPLGSVKYMTTYHSNITNFTGLVYRRHPITDKHLSSTTGCQNCHSRILTDEHYRPDRTDKNGNPINCDTCHTASYRGEEINTNGTLKLEKTNSSKSYATWSAPQGSTVSRIYIDHALITGVTMKVYAIYNGTWGLIYEGTGTTAKWLELPAPTTTIKTVVSPYYAFSYTYWCMDITKVTLTPNDTMYQNIQTAIKNKDTSCGACHSGVEMGHEAQHTSTLDTNCTGCHSAVLTTEHMNNSTTAGKNYTCDTCHANPNVRIIRTITAKNLNCAGCHVSAHGVKLIDSVPADISIYPGFDWSTPIEASIMNGEMPPGYGTGQVIISNRRADITSTQIWDYNNGQLSTNGWQLISPAPAPGTDYYAAEYKKESRYVTVRYFDTLNSDGSGGPVSSGYKIELWYK